jgi:hypothetical protein
VHSHSQGYDLVERPLIRADEPMHVAGGMMFAMHPQHATDAVFATICDNYLVDHDGTGSFLHRTPKQIFEI